MEELLLACSSSETSGKFFEGDEGFGHRLKKNSSACGTNEQMNLTYDSC